MVFDVEQLPEGAVILEPQRIFNAGILKFDGVLHYSLSMLIDSFLDKTEMEYIEIIDHLSFNAWGYCPENWPILVDDLRD
jgi:hypothetical protein